MRLFHGFQQFYVHLVLLFWYFSYFGPYYMTFWGLFGLSGQNQDWLHTPVASVFWDPAFHFLRAKGCFHPVAAPIFWGLVFYKNPPFLGASTLRPLVGFKRFTKKNTQWLFATFYSSPSMGLSLNTSKLHLFLSLRAFGKALVS